VVSPAELFHNIFAGAKGEGKNGKLGCFVSTVQENARVARVQIGYVVGLAKAIGNKLFGVIPHAALHPESASARGGAVRKHAQSPDGCDRARP
jgi:hypothetical protein